MYVIKKEFHFSASHILRGLEDGHPCGRMHGHNYVIIVELSSIDLDNTGFVEDYGQLKDIKQYIDGELDHRHLNDILPHQPSAELIAKHFFDKFKSRHPFLRGIGVKETPKTEAWYYGE